VKPSSLLVGLAVFVFDWLVNEFANLPTINPAVVRPGRTKGDDWIVCFAVLCLNECVLKLVDFTAVWCPPCQMMKPVFAELEKELAGRVAFEAVDVDNNPERAKHYGVMSVPTFVLEKDGTEVGRLIGAQPKEEMKTWLNKYLA
jgi:thioredoxin 1